MQEMGKVTITRSGTMNPWAKKLYRMAYLKDGRYFVRATGGSKVFGFVPTVKIGKAAFVEIHQVGSCWFIK